MSLVEMAEGTSNVSAENTKAVEEILKAAAEHDVVQLRQVLAANKFPDCEAVDVQNDRGTSALHSSIAACGAQPRSQTNGESSLATVQDSAANTVRFLLEEGAIWNQLDANNETPGCIAYRLELETLYQLMVDAGVRTEVLLNRLEGYEQLEDNDDADDAQGSVKDIENTSFSKDDTNEAPQIVEPITEGPAVANGDQKPDVNSSDYLSSTLSLTRDKILDGQQNGVMMEWESGIMKASVDALLDRPGLKLLNIGAGMMIFDSFVQASDNKPAEHHIVEAHPDILAHIEEQGWNQKPGVVVHAGKWQDVLPQLVADNQTFHAIYYDTFAESYADFREFFSEYVLGLLESDGKWSFFNGMGADRQISYDVYQKVVEMDLFEAGFDVQWQDIEIPVLDKEWEGVKRKYWNVKHFRLPVCKFMD